MKKHVINISLVVCLSFSCISLAGEHVLLDQCGPKAESFAFYIDVSGSMMQKVGEVKEKAKAEYEDYEGVDSLNYQKQLLLSDNKQVDDFRRTELAKALVLKSSKAAIEMAEMSSSLYSVAPFAVLVPEKKRDVDQFEQSVQERLNDDLEVFGRATWLGERGFKQFTGKRDKAEAVIFITDGNFDLKTDGKRSPFDAFKSFAITNPNSCVYIVSAAYRPVERDSIAKLSNLLPCTKTYEIEALVSNEQKFRNFLEEVFYKDCSKVPALELQNVYFEFDKAILTSKGKETLQRALQVLGTRDPSEHFTIVGWTDWMGSDGYNLELSHRRAEAVKDFFIQNGVSPYRMKILGKGKSFKYDNHTNDGRLKNRRVELIFSNRD